MQRTISADPGVQRLELWREIYSRTGRQLTAEALAAFEAYESRRPAHHFGRHVYTAQRYGLDEPRIRTAFAGYHEAFPQRVD